MKVKELITLLNYCQRGLEVRFMDNLTRKEFNLLELAEDGKVVFIVGNEVTE